MNESIKNLADKYFNNQCTPDEAEKVLQWLDTREGEHYLNKKIETDFDSAADEHNKEISHTEGLNSEYLLASIINRMDIYGFAAKKRTGHIKTFLQIAAGILVILMASLFYHFNTNTNITNAEAQTVRFNTNSEEQRNIRLGDGTEIRLNSNSELIIPANYMEGSREVVLNGEAFFNVENHTGGSFIIQTKLARVEVLGTSFNVKHGENSSRVEVSVVEGAVEFEGRYGNGQHQVTLRKGDYAYWDDDLRILNKENFGAENYLAWMTKELVFENLHMSKVCVQLNRFFEVTCQFETEEIKDLGLNANIPNPVLENTLSVIALSLNLEYTKDDGQIIWSTNGSK